MKALVIDHPGTIALHDVPMPDPPGECLVRVRMAGICGTDLQLLEGLRGVSWHSRSRVRRCRRSVASPDDAEWIGRRVVGDINIGCGRCEWCLAGVKEHCVSRTVVGIRGRDGAFAEFLSLPGRNLHAVPDAVDDAIAVFTEPTAAACRILEQVAIDDRTRVAVAGRRANGVDLGAGAQDRDT